MMPKQIKKIQPIDITCNLAFFDLCSQQSKVYLFCCTGDQYPNYPCFGSLRTGFAQHSSICRAALASGIKCGRQFIAFYAGESCTFEPFHSKEISTLPYKEWTKSYQIIEVNALLSEHTELKSKVKSLQDNKQVSAEIIGELRQKLEYYENENEKKEKQLVQLLKDSKEHINKINSLEKENCLIANNLRIIRNAPPQVMPINELKKLKTENKTLKDQQEKYIKETEMLKKEKKDVASVLEVLKVESENNRKKLELEEKQQILEKELSKEHFDLLHTHFNQLKQIVTDFNTQKDSLNSKFMSSCKENTSNDVVSLPLKKLKVQITNNLNEKDTEKFESNSIQEILSKLGEILMNKDEWPGSKETIDDFALQIKDFLTFIKEKSSNLGANEQKNALNVIKSYILIPAKHFLKQRLDFSVSDIGKQYKAQKANFEDLKNEIIELKKLRSVGETLKKTKEMQNVIKNDILPKNIKIRERINKRTHSKSLNDLKHYHFDSKPNKLEILAANEDSTLLKTLTPFSLEKKTKLQSKSKQIHNSIDQNQIKLNKSLENLEKLLLSHIQIIKVIEELKIEKMELDNELIVLEKIEAQWNQIKNVRSQKLAQIISKNNSGLEFGLKLEKLSEIGVKSIKEVLENEINASNTQILKLKHEYLDLFEELYRTFYIDRENKLTQLKKVSQMRSLLTEQLDEATELMDEDAVEQLQKQLNGLPDRETLIKSKLKLCEENIKDLDSNVESLKISLDLGRISAAEKVKIDLKSRQKLKKETNRKNVENKESLDVKVQKEEKETVKEQKCTEIKENNTENGILNTEKQTENGKSPDKIVTSPKEEPKPVENTDQTHFSTDTLSLKTESTHKKDKINGNSSKKRSKKRQNSTEKKNSGKWKGFFNSLLGPAAVDGNSNQ